MWVNPDNYHANSVTYCLTSLWGFPYTIRNGSDRTGHEKDLSKRLVLSSD